VFTYDNDNSQDMHVRIGKAKAVLKTTDKSGNARS